MQQPSKDRIHFSYVQGKFPQVEVTPKVTYYFLFLFLLPGIGRICPSGSTIQNPNRIIPSITLIPNFFIPTCQQADDYLKDSDGLDCDFVQSLAGYCGCEGVEKRNSCSFCPENQESQNLAFKTSSFFTCLDLVDYVEYLSPLDCNRTSDLSEKKKLSELQETCACTPVPTTAPTAPPSEDSNASDAPTSSPIHENIASDAPTSSPILEDIATDAPTSSPILEDIATDAPTSSPIHENVANDVPTSSPTTSSSSASACFFSVVPLLSLLIFLY
jgi:hypothetical protein